MLKLNQKLADLSWSQAELSRRINVSQTSISKWMTGKCKVPDVVLLYLDALIEIKSISDRLCK